jgi:hypothetical protein
MSGAFMTENADAVMRAVLWIGAAFNFGAAAMLAFPDTVGSFSGLPDTGPLLYRWLLVLFVALFGGAYAWLALQPEISRPLVALAALGKTGVFIVSVVCWLLGDIPLQSLPPAVCDLAFALVFAWWLMATHDRVQNSRQTVAADAASRRS